jgi:signal-transduction protein with cAMP-binding, CBS, and nucleotidyltransferase domain
MTSFFVPVRHVMNPVPVRIGGLASVQNAMEMMKANDLSSLVVERRDPRDEFGLVLITDIAREVIGQNRSMNRTSVYEIMVKPAPAVDADMNIKYAIQHMSRLGLSHCLVLESRELVGLVSLRQLALRYVEEVVS